MPLLTQHMGNTSVNFLESNLAHRKFHRSKRISLRMPDNRLVESSLALMETLGLITRAATPYGFRYQAGEEAGSFIFLLTTAYSEALKERA